MKAINSLFSMRHAQIIIFFLLFAASCHPPHGNDNQPVETAAVIADSLFTPTGDAKLDSLLQLAAVAKQDTNLAKLYHQIGERYSNIDFNKSGEYFILLKNLSEQLDWNPGRYMFSMNYPIMLLRHGKNDSALVVQKQALELAKKLNDEEWIADITVKIGISYTNFEWYETALQYFMDALPFTERMNNPEKLAYLYNTIGVSYRNLNEIEKAHEYGEKAHALQNDNLLILYQLGMTYSSLQKYEQANVLFEEALRKCLQQNNNYLMGAIYYNLGDNALRVYDLENAEKYIHQSQKIAQEFHIDITDNDVLLGKLEQLKGNFDKSKSIIVEALQDFIELDLPNKQGLCYTILSELSMAQHNYRQYTQYWGKKDSIENVIASESTLRAAAEMEAKYETEKKELEIERQQHIIERQNMQRWLLAGAIAIAAVILILLWYMLRLRNRRNHALTERNTALSERNDALADMNATKDKFFNIISHDLKNPAEAQRDALKLLVQHVGQWDANILAKYFEGLLETAEGQVELIYNLLGWAQLQTGRMVYRPSTFNLAAGLRSDISLIRNMAGKKDITVDVRIPEDADVTGDSNMLSAAVRNLLSNAIKFTPVGGTVTLEASPYPSTPFPLQVLPPTGEEKGKRELGGEFSPPSGELVGACISITDTGIGMTEEEISSLFRLDSAQSRRGTAGEQGSGLGLIVCKELLEKHGSVLHVESTPGSGSRFWFTI